MASSAHMTITKITRKRTVRFGKNNTVGHCPICR